MKKHLLILIFLMQGTISYSQSQNLIPVKVVFETGDLKQGFIPADHPEDFTTIQFKEDQTGDFHKLHPAGIESIKSDNGLEILPYNFNGQDYFLIALVKGEADLYYLRNKSGRFHYFSKKEENPFRQLTVNKTTEDIDGKKFNNYSKIYLGVLEVIFSDCRPEELEKIKLSTRSLINVFTVYNECKKNLTYINPEKKQEDIRLAFLGGINYTNTSPKISGMADNFKPETGLKAGLEFSYIPAFSSRLEGAIGLYYSEKGGKGEYIKTNKYESAVLDYKLIEAALSLRYKLFDNDQRLNPYLGISMNKGFLTNKGTAALKYNEEGEESYLYHGTFIDLEKSTPFFLSYEAGLYYRLGKKNGLVLKGIYYSHHDGSKMYQFQGITAQAGYYFSL